MAAVIATVAVVGAIAAGTAQAISGAKGKREAKKKQNAAETGLREAQEGLKAVDTSNPFEDAKNAYEGLENVYEDQENVYEDMENKMKGQKNAFEGMENKFEGMENAFEDLAVNTQQAEFEAQQNQQQQANIMSSMAGAAGGSGIAALAQSMANQGALQAQKASASIGAQESDNQKKAAEAEQSINMATAEEGSKMQTMQAQEQSRLDTQERQADMEIQRTQMGAEEAMQAARLGEASKLQMKEAEGAMEVQELKGQGQLDAASLEMQKQQSLMNASMQEMGMHSEEARYQDEKKWAGITSAASAAGSLSDIRAKENIIKISYSPSGVPIYHFNYKGDNTTWSGTMAQDLIKLGKEDAVTKREDGYYSVNYNLIDVDMKRVKPSPLKQLNEGGSMGGTPQEDMNKRKSMNDAGLDILSGAKARLNWEELQRDIKNIEPPSMRKRKLKDQLLRDKERKTYEARSTITLPSAYIEAGHSLVKGYKKELVKALDNEDEVAKGMVKTKLAQLAENVKVVKENIEEFYDDQFNPETLLSKGVSQQQISFATQMYCKNPELKVVYAATEDVESGHTDFYGDLVTEGSQYCIVYDFYNNPTMVNVLDGNKDMFIRNNLKAMEYINFLNETFEKAQEANAGKSAVKIDLGRINYKIDSMFGYNDGTATKEQDELVMMFCHDSEVLRDGSTFRRHLYEHPNIGNLNYGGFDWSRLQFNIPLGPGDKDHWADEITEQDKLRLVKAIIDVDDMFFNMKLLRTLVKEYYTYKLESAWWKGMGYPEGKLDIMRLKQNELVKARFKKEKAEASKNGMLKFMFDGKVYPTGMTPAKVKQQEEERGEAAEKAQKDVAANQANPGLNQ